MADSANEAESFPREMPLLTRLLTVSLTVPSVSGFKTFLRAIANLVQIGYVTHKKKEYQHSKLEQRQQQSLS